ncbi:MAG: hypothetical protein QOE93_200, partial [Actinomycetota bacterium]|nr:hypothetical protein [Actinomycetota bacterium]
MAESEKQLDQSSSYHLADDAPGCDMVMKGGITSGVVYPRAACHLATTYRFRRLGGSSAGAIAATMAAAAEVGRASTTGGFPKLYAIPTELGKSLSLLFQAPEPTRPALALLMTWVDPKLGTMGRIGRTIRALAGGTSVLTGLGAAVVTLLPLAAYTVALVGNSPGTLFRDLLVWLPLALIIGFVVAMVTGAVRLAKRTLAGVNGNGFGLCDGHTKDPSIPGPPLTDWMADNLDDIAAIPQSLARPAGTPLTFGDLWGKDAADAYRKAMPDVTKGEATALSPVERQKLAAERVVDVVVMTTDMCHRRPYRFPFSTQEFFWCPECFEKYFPERVVAHLRATGKETEGDDDPVDGPIDARRQVRRICPIHPGARLWHLPLAVDIPVVMAARLSLSYPALFSTVPFHIVDFATPEGHRAVKTVWFSDGGITANFPMHFFDTLLPRRPTFGINLTKLHPDSDKVVWRPTYRGASGGLARHVPITSVFGFVAALIDTLQNSADNMQVTMPAFKKRIAQVRQRDDEGGLNLKMDGDTITELANRGADAAAEFDDFPFDDHRDQRYRIAMAGLDEVLHGLQAPYPEYKDLLTRPGRKTTVTPELLGTSDEVLKL